MSNDYHKPAEGSEVISKEDALEELRELQKDLKKLRASIARTKTTAASEEMRKRAGRMLEKMKEMDEKE